jgi:hypothetical protein
MASENALRDQNATATLIVESSTVAEETVRLKADPATGGLIVAGGGGSAASGSATTNIGTVVKAVTRLQANKQTRTNGQVSDIITDENENQWVRESYAPGYEDNAAGVAKVEQRYLYASVATAATTPIKSGAGFIHQIRVVGGTLGAVTVYDNTAGSGTIIVPTVTPTTAGILIEDVTFSTGLTIVTAAATIITVSFR